MHQDPRPVCHKGTLLITSVHLVVSFSVELFDIEFDFFNGGDYGSGHFGIVSFYGRAQFLWIYNSDFLSLGVKNQATARALHHNDDAFEGHPRMTGGETFFCFIATVVIATRTFDTVYKGFS